MNRFLALAVALIALLLTPATAAANQVSCDYSANDRLFTVNVTASEDFAPTIWRDSNGDVTVVDSDGPPPGCEPIPATRVEKVIINKTGSLSSGPFSDITYLSIRTPWTGGYTDEPGSSDEIEIEANFSGGTLSITSSHSTSDPGVQVNLRLGGNQVNLNADEADGIDADLTVNGVAELNVAQTSHPDTIDGSGGAGTSATPFTIPITTCYNGLPGADDHFVGGDADDSLCPLDGDDYVNGGAGDDFIRSDDFFFGTFMTPLGNDVIQGGPGDDEVDAGGGDDQIAAGGGRDQVKAGAGNDRLFGQGGKDKLSGGDGDDRHNGGPGRDRCSGGTGANVFVSCEQQS